MAWQAIGKPEVNYNRSNGGSTLRWHPFETRCWGRSVSAELLRNQDSEQKLVVIPVVYCKPDFIGSQCDSTCMMREWYAQLGPFFSVSRCFCTMTLVTIQALN